MNVLEVMDFINEIEEKFPVDEWVVDGIHVWPLIRIQLAMELGRQGTNTEGDNPSESERSILKYIRKAPMYIRGWARQYKASFLDRGANVNPNNTYDIVALSNSTCRRLINNKWYDIFFDPIIDELNVGMKLFELTPKYEYRIPRYSRSNYIQNKLDVIRIMNIILPGKETSYNLPRYNEAVNYVVKKSGIQIQSITKLIKRVRLVSRFSLFWENKLTKIRPSLVIIECYYSDIGMALNMAASRLNIPSIDVQHGVQGDYHIAYGRWNNVPENGYELLPRIFWCWSEKEKRIINNWANKCYKRHNAVIGGNMILDMWLNDENKIIKNYDELLYPMFNEKKEQVNILYTLQPGYDPPEWFLEYIQSSPPNWKWWIRLHQGMQEELSRITKMLSTCNPANIDIKNATIVPLPALLRHIDAHITLCSSTVIEAEEFGVPSILLDRIGELVYKDQISTGYARYTDNKDSLDKILNDYIAGKSYFIKSLPKPFKKYEVYEMINSILDKKVK